MLRGDEIIRLEGRLSRVPVGQLLVPARVWLEGDLLCHREEFKRDSKRPDRHLLASFIEHSAAGDGAVLRFATRWGALRVCEHGLPASHTAPRDLDPSWFGWDNPEWRTRTCWPVMRRDRTFAEPIATWRRLGERMDSLVRIAAALRYDKLGRIEDWNHVYGPWPIKGREYSGVPTVEPGENPNIPNWARTVPQEHLLSLAGVGPTLGWDSRGPATFALAGGWLFGALVLQLMLHVGHTEVLEACSACGAPYSPSRKPRQGEEHFCPDCGREEARRRAQRRYYERKRGLTRGGVGATQDRPPR
jgi:predicted RNA-binding Zn-ribbon protein involved in translation (DUF1610 family)